MLLNEDFLNDTPLLSSLCRQHRLGSARLLLQVILPQTVLPANGGNEPALLSEGACF